MKKIFLILFVSLLIGCGQPSAPIQEKEVEEVKTPAVEEVKASLVEEQIVEEVPVVEVVEEVVSTISPTGGPASITGVIRYDGDVPKFRPIKMDADPTCLTKHADEVLPQTLVLGDLETKTMANVFVHITSGLAKKAYPTPTEPVVLDQNGCMYDPHVLGVMVNQPIRILNSDGTLHNVHALPKINAEFNLAMPKFRKETIQTFSKAEFMFPMKCDVHPWMGAWIAVMNHPFFSVTKSDGAYSISNLSAGTYTLEAWHEKLGTQTQTVTLVEGEQKEINFVFAR